MPHKVVLSKDELRAIEVFAKTASAEVTVQLVQATNMLLQHVDCHSNTYEEREAWLDKTLSGIFGREPLQQLHMRKVLALPVLNHIDLTPTEPNSRDTFEIFCRMNIGLVPNRILQRLDYPALKELTPEFTEELCRVMHSVILKDIENCGPEPSHIFVRQQKLYNIKHDRPQDAKVCIFKLLEEDYSSPEYLSRIDEQKPELVHFGFTCTHCNDRHEMRVFR
ncbi:hypothetical protein K458DRAFT_399151 [Lentithecium fluviatile CBS 122367]|uniref:Uncharacterized protein n=1 Tax=Lentithecium fluviatile CBS 122367 TaxID=1168545 RepID=A0A6G1JL25_9PLEO|nr:hypothetical protein K458DRAFT_399151 [Lentithecium fluviatile CBS 122367]